nr:immunoglobulin light chain junction region [Macaca mulatta]MOX32214.1 immunoglobulin light chain junction region [Macaca mulatta]
DYYCAIWYNSAWFF